MVQTRVAEKVLAVVILKRKRRNMIPEIQAAVHDHMVNQHGVKPQRIAVKFHESFPARVTPETYYFRLDSRLKPTPA